MGSLAGEPPGLGYGCVEKGPWPGEQVGQKVEGPQGLRRGEQQRVPGSLSLENLRTPHSVDKSMRRVSPSSRWPWLGVGWISVNAGGHRCRRLGADWERHPSPRILAPPKEKGEDGVG